MLFHSCAEGILESLSDSYSTANAASMDMIRHKCSTREQHQTAYLNDKVVHAVSVA